MAWQPHRVNSSFITYLPKNERTFGLPNQYDNIYDPVNMVDQACEVFAHIDLNYDYYMRLLSERYASTTSDNYKKVLSRIIGLFKPYQKVMLPVLDASAIRAEISNKRLKEKIRDS